MNEMPGTAPATLHYVKRTTCRLCDSRKLDLVLSLGNQYVVNFPVGKDTSLPKAPIELVMCSGCGLLQLHHTVDPNILWRGDYWYRSSVNQTMRDALTDVVQSAGRHHKEGTWIDIGANDGYLLSRVPAGFRRIAFEPAKSLIPQLEEHADVVVNDFWDGGHEVLKEEPAQVITSCACFYDVDDPNRFVAGIAKALASDGVWINQLNDSGQMIRSNAWDAICHEHVTYWSLANLERIYADHGLRIVGITHNAVNGGSVRVHAKKGSRTTSFCNPPEVKAIESFANRVARWKDTMGWMLDAMHMAGRSVWVYGASTKGCTMLQYLDRSHAFQGIADRNPIKHGRRMAGTWLPIVSEEDMRSQKPNVLFCPIWAFKDEVLERERNLREAGTAIWFPMPDISIVL